MDPLKWSQLRESILADIERNKGNALATRGLHEVLGQSYVEMLESIPDTEAREYLMNVEEQHLPGAYLVLSRRIRDPVLVEICIEYIRRSSFVHRLVGISQLGSCLYQSHDAKACLLLATIVRDENEDKGLRRLAYNTLRRITGGEVQLFFDKDPSTWLDQVDWSFVDSFVAAGGY